MKNSKGASFLLGSRPFLPLWIVFHFGVLVLLGLSVLFVGPVSINTSLFDILPAGSLQEAAQADRVLTERSGRGITILAGHEDFAQAKAGAEALYARLEELRKDGFLETLSLRVDSAAQAQLTRYLFDYRYLLLDAATQGALEAGGAAALAGEALASAYGAFSFNSLDNLEEDPFMLTERLLRGLLSTAMRLSGSAALRDEVLSVQHEGVSYVMIRGTISPGGASVTNRKSAVREIYREGRDLERETGIRLVYSGAPFHSYESSSNAQREISLISSISMGIILILFLLVFRSPFPAIVSACSIGLSVGAAVGTAALVFREIHVLTFVFGTALIGSCVDYSIHFFIQWGKNGALATGEEIRRRVFRSVTLSFISTEICFAALLFAPFVILKQFAVFSLAGLFSAYITVVGLYPLFKKRPKALSAGNSASCPAGAPGKTRFPGRIIMIPFVLLLLLALFVKRDHARLENNLRDLYSMPPHLLESERISAQALNLGASGSYFIVAGASPEEVLLREEALMARLTEEIDRGRLGASLGTTLFIPSASTQARNYRALETLLPLAEGQYAALGFPEEAARRFRLDFAAARDKIALPESAPPYLADLVGNLWLGNPGDGGLWYSCVMPFHVKDEGALRGLAGELPGIYFLNKTRDIGEALDRLTRIMFGLFLLAYGVILILVKIFYPWKKALRICAVPPILTLAALAALAWADIPLGFFPMVGLILVFGLGLDYMFYIAETEDPQTTKRDFRLTMTAIFLSFATTALSFGALALSSFIPVRVFGLTVFAGLSAAYISAMLLRGKDRTRE